MIKSIDYQYINLSPSQFWLQLRRVDLGGRTHGDSMIPRFDARPWHDDVRMQVAAYETRSERERKIENASRERQVSVRIPLSIEHLEPGTRRLHTRSEIQVSVQ